MIRPCMDRNRSHPRPTTGNARTEIDDLSTPKLPSSSTPSGKWLPSPWCMELQETTSQLKRAIDVPMLGTIIETNGDNLDDSHMPIGWPLLIDGAVRQFCVHRYTTIQDMQDILSAYNLSKNSVEINKDAPQWTHFSAWNRKYMDPLPGNDLRRMWQECEPAIGRKIAASYDIRVNDIRRNVSFIHQEAPFSSH